MAGVTDPLHNLSPQYPERWLSRWERWATDETGQPILEFDAEAHGEWCAQWTPPCPVGCPVRVSLDRPLGERAVIDVDHDEELPLYVPKYLNNVVQPDHGYHPANRRRRRPEALDDTHDVEPSSHRGHRLG